MTTFVKNNDFKSNWRNNSLPNYYLPKAIKNVITKGLEDKLPLQDFIKSIKKLNINKSKPLWITTLIFIIHLSY